MRLSPGTKRRRNDKRDENRRSRLAAVGSNNGSNLLSLWKQVTSRPVIDVATDDDEESSTPASVLAPASPNKPDRKGKSKRNGKSSPSDLENRRDISRDMEEVPDNNDGGLGHSGQSMEPAPPRKKQSPADKAWGGGGGGDGLDGLDKATGGELDRDSPVGVPAVSGAKRRKESFIRRGTVVRKTQVVREHHDPLPPHQAKLLEVVKTSVAHPSFSANRNKLEEIAQQHAEDTSMRVGVSTEDVILEACREYSLGTMLALSHLSQRRLTDSERREAGIEVFDRRKRYEGAFNYCHIYAFSNEEATLDMVDRWQTEMGVGAQLCGAVRSKIEWHDWSGGVALRLLISGEGLTSAADKYASTLLNPPTAARAKQPRQVNGRVANDGPAWNVAAGMALVGGGALRTVDTETYVWKAGDPHRSTRELHEALLMLGFLGGLVWNPASVGLNQKVGGTFNDEQRSRGGKRGGEASIRNRKKDPEKYKNDCSAGGAAKYTAEERGADKSTVELKAQGGKIGGTNSSTAYGTAGAETDGRNGQMGNTHAAGNHAPRSAVAGTSASWANGVRWECTRCADKGKGGVFREEDGKVRLPRHRKKVGGTWTSCGKLLPSHPGADIPIVNVQWVGLDAKPFAARRKRKAQKAAN